MVMYSAAVSVKMNVLLMAPPVLVVMLKVHPVNPLNVLNDPAEPANPA